MKKIKLSKKMKFLIGLSGVAIVGITLPVALLTSCSSAANPYGPYTVISTSNNSSENKAISSQVPNIKYDTKRQEYYVWNDGSNVIKDSNYPKYNNLKDKWVSSNDVLNYYNWLSNQEVKKQLPSGSDKESNRKAILEKYYYTGNDSTNGATTQDSNELLDNAVKNYNFEGLNFVYGVKPSKEMQEAVEIYNQMTIQGNIFKLASALSTELISYGITSEFAGMYNWLANGKPNAENNPLSIVNNGNGVQTQNGVTNVVPEGERQENAKNFANNSVVQWGQKIKSNKEAIEFTMGVGTIVGEGGNTYHLWPSGFTAKYEWTQTGDEGTAISTEKSNVNVAKPGINNPYPINPGEKGPTQYTLKVTDIQINYQWYKAKKTGGDYVTYKQVNDHLNTQQHAAFKVANEDGLVHNSAYKLPISSLEFNVTPMTSSYVDPIQNSLIDYVYNGVYTIQPRLVNTNNDINWNVKTPSQLLSKTSNGGNGASASTTADDNSAMVVPNVPWQSFRNISKNKFNKEKLINDNLIYQSTADAIWNSMNTTSGSSTKENEEVKLGDNLSDVPYYQANSQSWTANSDYEAAFQITNGTNNQSTGANKEATQNNALLNYYQTKNLIGLFSNVYGNAGLKPEDRPVYNNFNNINKYIFLKMWELGWMANNVSKNEDAKDIVSNSKYLHDGKTQNINQISPEWTKEYKEVVNKLKSGKSLHDILVNESKETTNSGNNNLVSTAKKGLETFYTIVKPDQIKPGDIYEINNSTGQITTKQENMTTGSTTTTPSNQSIIVNDNRRQK